MKKGQKRWTREELIVVINQYFKLPFGKLHQRNPKVIELAQLIGRTPGSIAFKLVNFASLDQSIIDQGKKGASNTSKLDREVWDEFYEDWERAAFESESILLKLHNEKGKTGHFPDRLIDEDTGTDRYSFTKKRIYQSFFRQTLLASYDETCCITGLNLPELLVAGHILPWAEDKKNRLNPRNGLVLNSLHDKAFENGLITVNTDYRVKISSILLRNQDTIVQDNFAKFDGQRIRMPSRFIPDPQFLSYHNEKRFRP